MKSLEQSWGSVVFDKTAAAIPVKWEMKNGVPVGGWRNGGILLKVLAKLPDATIQQLVPKVFRGGRIPNHPAFRGQDPRQALLTVLHDPRSTAGTIKTVITALIEIGATV